MHSVFLHFQVWFISTTRSNISGIILLGTCCPLNVGNTSTRHTKDNIPFVRSRCLPLWSQYQYGLQKQQIILWVRGCVCWWDRTCRHIRLKSLLPFASLLLCSVYMQHKVDASFTKHTHNHIQRISAIMMYFQHKGQYCSLCTPFHPAVF